MRQTPNIIESRQLISSSHFVPLSLVTGCCYRLLENPTIGHQKNRSTREAITRLLGVALTHYNHMLSKLALHLAPTLFTLPIISHV